MITHSMFSNNQSGSYRSVNMLSQLIGKHVRGLPVSFRTQQSEERGSKRSEEPITYSK